MLIARVVGSAVSTIKVDGLRGLKLLLVRETTPQDELVGDPFVAVDGVGAGVGEVVLVARGRPRPPRDGRSTRSSWRSSTPSRSTVDAPSRSPERMWP